MIVLPKWYSKAEDKLNKCIDDIIRSNDIDWGFAHDSRTIEDGRNMILNALLRISQKVESDYKKLKDIQK